MGEVRWADNWIAEGTMSNLEAALVAAEELGIKIEVADGVTTWKASPVLRHQRRINRIRATIRPITADFTSSSCVDYYNLSIRFVDGSHKRPDISIFCREPDELDTEVTLLPEAVIEILSAGYAAKDLRIGVPFYLKMGIKDVIVVDPKTDLVKHFRPGEPVRDLQSPIRIELVCGCECTV